MQIPTNERRVQEQPAGNVQIQGSSVQATPEAFGAAQAKQIGDLSSAIYDAGMMITDNANKAKARDAINQAREKSQQMVIEALNSRGANAQTAGIELQKKLKALRNETLKGLDNPAQSKMVGDAFDSYALEHMGSVKDHVVKEGINYQNETYDAANANTVSNIPTIINSPKRVAAGAKEIEQNIQAQGKLNGWSEEVINAKASEGLKLYHTTVVENLRVKGPMDAAKYLEDNKAHIDARTRYTMLKSLSSGMEDSLAVALSTRFSELGLVTTAQVSAAISEYRKANGLDSISYDTEQKILNSFRARMADKVASDQYTKNETVKAFTEQYTQAKTEADREAVSNAFMNNPKISGEVKLELQEVKDSKLVKDNPVAIAAVELLAMSDPKWFNRMLDLNFISYTKGLNKKDRARILEIRKQAESGAYNNKEYVTAMIESASIKMPKAEAAFFNSLVLRRLGPAFSRADVEREIKHLTSMENGELRYQDAYNVHINEQKKDTVLPGIGVSSTGERIVSGVTPSMAAQINALASESSIIKDINELNKRIEKVYNEIYSRQAKGTLTEGVYNQLKSSVADDEKKVKALKDASQASRTATNEGGK